MLRHSILIICAIFALNQVPISGFKFNTRRLPGQHCLTSTILEATKTNDAKEFPGTDLTGYKLYCTFTGFGVANMTCGIELKEKFEVEFSQGISQAAPGFWRIVKFDDGREQLEAVHPVTPEYMYFFDIWESNIIWRGQLDMKSMKITSGQVVTNKKKFGIFPYTETLATFEADLLSPSEKFPVVDIPNVADIQWIPPEDFSTPYDMRRYPEIFDPEYVEWWFAVEDALANGETPPPRPKPFFTPKVNKNINNDDEELDDNRLIKQRRRKNDNKPTGMISPKE